MATTYTGAVKLPLQGLDDPANIELMNEGFRLTDAAIQKAWQGMAAHNLLSNADFTRPYNQRGLTAYSGNDYTIDRWRIGNAQSKVNVYSQSVQLQAVGGTCNFRQMMEPTAYMGGKAMTAVLWTTEGVTGICSGTMPAEVPTTNAVFASTTVKEGVTLSLRRETTGYLVYQITVADGYSISLLRAAVYVGGYTAANVPEFEPEKPAEVAADCREYFRRNRAESTYGTVGLGVARSATSAWINVPRAGRMRIGKPTIKTSGTLLLYGGSASSVPATAVTLDKVSDSYIRLTVTASGLTVGAAVVATADGTGDFMLDEIADL